MPNETSLDTSDPEVPVDGHTSNAMAQIVEESQSEPATNGQDGSPGEGNVNLESDDGAERDSNSITDERESNSNMEELNLTVLSLSQAEGADDIATAGGYDSGPIRIIDNNNAEENAGSTEGIFGDPNRPSLRNRDASLRDYVPPIPPVPWHTKLIRSIRKCFAIVFYPIFIAVTTIAFFVVLLFCVIPALIGLGVGLACYYCIGDDPIPLSVLLRYIFSTDEDDNNDFPSMYTVAQKRFMIQKNLIFREVTKIEDERSSKFMVAPSGDDEADGGGDGLSKYPRHFPFAITVRSAHKTLHFSAPIKYDEDEKEGADKPPTRGDVRVMSHIPQTSNRRGTSPMTDYGMGSETMAVIGGDGNPLLGTDGHNLNMDIESLPPYQRPAPNTPEDVTETVSKDAPFFHREPEPPQPIESLDEIRMEVGSGLEPLSMDDLSETGLDPPVVRIDSTESADDYNQSEEGRNSSGNNNDERPEITTNGESDNQATGGILTSIISTFIGDSNASSGNQEGTNSARANESSGEMENGQRDSTLSPNVNPLPRDSTAATIAEKIHLAALSVEDVVAEHGQPSPTENQDFFGLGDDSRDRGTSCDICLLSYEVSDIVAWSPNAACNHVYHRDCILDWLVRKPTCPNCRNDFTKANTKEKKKRRSNRR